MSIEKKSLISTLKTTKKANVASGAQGIITGSETQGSAKGSLKGSAKSYMKGSAKGHMKGSAKSYMKGME